MRLKVGIRRLAIDGDLKEDEGCFLEKKRNEIQQMD